MTLAQMIARLTRGYIKETGRQPVGLDKLRIKMEAAEKLRQMNKIIQFPQQRSFKQEVDDMIKDGTIKMGGVTKQSDKVKTRQMFKDSNLNKPRVVKTEDQIREEIKANNKKFIQSLKDNLDDPENMADGGVAGLLGERTGFRGGGRYQGGSGAPGSAESSSKSKSSTNQGPAGGASAGGNYGGNVNPNQTYGGGGPKGTTGGGGGGPPGTNTGGGGTTTTTTGTSPPSVREIVRQRQIIERLKNLGLIVDEEDLALGAGPPTVLGTILKKGVKGVKPKIGKKGLGLEYLKEMDPYGNSLKFNLGTEYKDLLKGKLKPKLELKGTKGDLEYGFGVDKDKNINFGIKMPFGKQPKSKSRNFQKRFAPDISKFNFEDLTGIPSQAPTNMQMAKVYGAPELTEFGATPGMFKDTAKFNDMEKYQEIANKQFKMGKEPSAIRDSIKIGSSLYGIDMDNIPKDFLETEEDFKNQKILGDIEFAKGGIARQNFAMGRRAFLKMLAGTGAGIAGLKSGLIGTGGKEVTKKAVTETVKSAGSGYPPPYFFKLVDKIKFMGDDVTKKAATQERQVVKRYKDYEMSEDLGTGEIVIKKRNEGSFYDQDGIISDEYIIYKPGQADELTKSKPPPEYDEYTVRPDADGKLRDSEDGLDSINEILEEVGDTTAMTLKKASGGIARMLGE